MAIYCSNLDANARSASLSSRHSLKTKLALQIYQTFKRKGYFNSAEIYAQSFLMRPQWLSLMVVSYIVSDLTGQSLRNPTSIGGLAETLRGKEIVLGQTTRTESVPGDTKLHNACRYVYIGKLYSAISVQGEN